MATNGTNSTANGTHQYAALCTSAEDFLSHKYHYLIIGGGTAGLTIAARLTENPNVTVGVLEAGHNGLDEMFIDVPAMFSQTYSNPRYDWMFNTIPQIGNKNEVHHQPRGKVLGGSSAINYMMYVRGSLQDYDDWATILDDPSWNSSNMSHYMRKHETLEPIPEKVVDRATLPFVGKNHGLSGPVRTSFNESYLPIEHDYIKAADEVAGYTNKPLDPWSGDHMGFYNTLGTVCRSGPNKGKRSYAARDYFAGMSAERSNLHVLCDAMVTCIELDEDRATGIKFAYKDKAHTVRTEREIIVCCGAMQSPQILEVSGIGDPRILEGAGVKCKIENRAVGANFQDHVLTAQILEVEPGVLTNDIIHVPEVMQGALKELTEEGSGGLTHIASVQGFFTYKTFASKEEQAEIVKMIEDDLDKVSPFQRKQYEATLEQLKEDKSANLQVIMVPLRGSTEASRDQAKLFAPPPAGSPMAFTSAVCLTYPLSRGTVHIKSSDVNEPPMIDPAYLKHPADTAVLAAGVKMIERLAHSKHLKGKVSKRVFPTPEKDMLDTKQAREAVRDWVMTQYHPVGSCAMGDALDKRLMLKGTRNIRVADASIFPNHVSGNIVSSVYAVAEKAADMIKEDWDFAALSKAS